MYNSNCTRSHRQVTIYLPKFGRKAFQLASRINDDIGEDAKARGGIPIHLKLLWVGM